MVSTTVSDTIVSERMHAKFTVFHIQLRLGKEDWDEWMQCVVSVSEWVSEMKDM